ncbi:MAG: helix-turn-helix transcriptional regulator [Thermoplasmata archaeon]|nr:helix-turn-helix transcriptional regulator [Thermoplasmata archaeon]
MSSPSSPAARRGVGGSLPGSPAGCPVGELFAMLGQPHMLRILHTFGEQGGRPVRFRELETKLSLSPRTLSGRLRTLVEAGLLTRTAYGEVPPRVEYALTPKAIDLGHLFDEMEAWARRNTLTAVSSITRTGPTKASA